MDKKKAHKRYKTFWAYNDYVYVDKLRSECKAFLEVYEHNFISSVEQNIISESKSF